MFGFLKQNKIAGSKYEEKKSIVVNPAVGIVSFVGDSLQTILQENRKKISSGDDN